MANVLVVAKDELFKNDLISQIRYHVPEFAICGKDDKPDVVVVDDDMAKAEEWADKKIPLIFLTEKENGAILQDAQIISKPLGLGMFLDALRAATMLFGKTQSGCLDFGNYILYPGQKEIVDIVTEEVCKLTEKEVDIIKYLYKNSGKYVSKQDLLKDVWGYADDATTHTVETHIYRLRQKVENGKEQLIETSEGGYKLKV